MYVRAIGGEHVATFAFVSRLGRPTSLAWSLTLKTAVLFLAATTHGFYMLASDCHLPYCLHAHPWRLSLQRLSAVLSRDIILQKKSVFECTFTWRNKRLSRAEYLAIMALLWHLLPLTGNSDFHVATISSRASKEISLH